MDTEARAAEVVAEECFQGALDDKSGFHPFWPLAAVTAIAWRVSKGR